MEAATSIHPFESNHSPSSFTVVMLYEDFVTGRRAKQTYDQLASQFGADCLFHDNMWKFDVLRLPKLKEMAAREAAGADMVIISMHGANEVPQEVRTWLDLWLELKGDHPAALVTLLDSSGDQISPSACDFFREAARRGGLDFFVQMQDPFSHRPPEVAQLEKAPQPTHFDSGALMKHFERNPAWDLDED